MIIFLSENPILQVYSVALSNLLLFNAFSPLSVTLSQSLVVIVSFNNLVIQTTNHLQLLTFDYQGL